MVYKLKPLELSFDFEDGEYALGDTVRVQLTLEPNGDVHVREARIDLVCEQKHSRQDRGVMVGMGGVAGIQGGNPHTSTDYVPMATSVSQRTESYIHSNVVLFTDTPLSGDRPSIHGASLEIQPAHPERLKDAWKAVRDSNESWSFKWRLVASVDIVRGRNPKRQRALNVKLPPRPRGESGASAAKGTVDRYEWRKGKRRSSKKRA